MYVKCSIRVIIVEQTARDLENDIKTEVNSTRIFVIHSIPKEWLSHGQCSLIH